MNDCRLEFGYRTKDDAFAFGFLDWVFKWYNKYWFLFLVLLSYIQIFVRYGFWRLKHGRNS